MDAVIKLLTPTEYLALERNSETKHEYYAGQIYPMAGATERHNLISLNAGSELRVQLRKRPYRVYVSDMRVKISETGLYTYPDVTVVGGEPQFEGNQSDVLLNPVVIIKVLSKSTEAYDRGKKFEHYRTISTLVEYLLIAQDSYHIEHYIRQTDGQWLYTATKGLQRTVHLPMIGCDLQLEEVYDKVEVAATQPYRNGAQE